jgi:coenzyme F420 biosynthesis associated uncharacterized protein
MIDWRLAATVANGVASAQATPDGAAFTALAAPAAESERLVAAYTGLVAELPVPRAEAVTRPQWIDSNLTSLRSVLEPAADRLGDRLGPLRGPMGAAVGALLAAEAGVVAGLLSTRVLGQYEFPVLEPDVPARLLFVAPNLAHAAGTLEAEPEALLKWVALHEITHALQFGGVAWLRPHLGALLREILSALDVDPRGMMRRPGLGDLGELVEAVRSGGVAGLVLGPERRGQLERVQAVMAVLEGYAEHVMDAVGIELIPDLPRLRSALERRRRDRSGLLRLLEKLLGFDLKLRQYEQGKAWCDAVVARAGMSALNRVWDGPEQIPTLAELDDAPAWLARVMPRAA